MANHQCNSCKHEWYSQTPEAWCPFCNGTNITRAEGGSGGGFCSLIALALLIPLTAASVAWAF